MFSTLLHFCIMLNKAHFPQLPDAAKPFIVIDGENVEMSKQEETYEKTEYGKENVKSEGKKKVNRHLGGCVGRF